MKTIIIVIAFLVAVPVYGQVTEMTAVDSPVISADAHEAADVDEVAPEPTPAPETRQSSSGGSSNRALMLQLIELLQTYIALLQVK